MVTIPGLYLTCCKVQANGTEKLKKYICQKKKYLLFKYMLNVIVGCTLQ